jgi:polyisoprenoid-binding protein YceI
MKPGTYTFGPADGTLRVRTGRQGLVAMVGHDLTLEAANWSATATVDAEVGRSEVRAVIEPRSLEVVGATGGAKPVSERDKRDIKKNIAGLLGNDSITFQSTSVEARDGVGVTVMGDLSIARRIRRVTVDLTVAPDGSIARLQGRIPLVQSDFGLKPFVGLMGALKVKDEVEVDLDIRLPAG